MDTSNEDWPSKHLLDVDNTLTSKSLDEASRGYLQAEAVCKSWGLTSDDVARLTPKFWRIHLDPIWTCSGPAFTIMAIQYNLVVGTLRMFSKGRSDLRAIIDDMMVYKALGLFLLSEVGHGLDIANLRTTATLLPSGGFELHTTSSLAAKYMPPTVPVLGKPAFGIVWAKLIINGEVTGIRPFLVKINDGKDMYKGISARVLPRRNGSSPLNHAITTFHRVRLPPSALLGELDNSVDVRLSLWRVGVGAISLSAIAITCLKVSSSTVHRYSLRRHVGVPRPVPIISFRTQQIPIFTAVAQAYVFEALLKTCIQNFMDDSAGFQTRHAVATIFKTMVVEPALKTHYDLSVRCGAQGLFDYNQVISFFSNMRGISIAEGDVLVLCIRLASELLLGRYSIPETLDSSSLLAKHESALFNKYTAMVEEHGHRGDLYRSFILPQSQTIIESIGHRMAYDAAVTQGVPQALIDIYECYTIKRDVGWYIEVGVLTQDQVASMEDRAMKAAFPHMSQWVDGMGVSDYLKAPILSEDRWDKFVDGLPSIGVEEKGLTNVVYQARL
ncbi:related to acyl-CoA oxidase [Armillaria ostoyae]|uniref:Related to acyl-CoA oxidase n=1 Tax=Armillaria ostoyae TaxID=47428 RepID=A0A284RE65_ARMOS|nr:related to acyl-CoA oxidase [Armillaria ostoyae]